MSVTHQDVHTLSALVVEEQGKDAVAYVDRHINKLRLEGDEDSALLWSKVLAHLYHQLSRPSHKRQ